MVKRGHSFCLLLYLNNIKLYFGFGEKFLIKEVSPMKKRINIIVLFTSIMILGLSCTVNEDTSKKNVLPIQFYDKLEDNFKSIEKEIPSTSKWVAYQSKREEKIDEISYTNLVREYIYSNNFWADGSVSRHANKNMSTTTTINYSFGTNSQPTVTNVVISYTDNSSRKMKTVDVTTQAIGFIFRDKTEEWAAKISQSRMDGYTLNDFIKIEKNVLTKIGGDDMYSGTVEYDVKTKTVTISGFYSENNQAKTWSEAKTWDELLRSRGVTIYTKVK